MRIKEIVYVSESIYLRCLEANDATVKYASWLGDPVVNKFLETKESPSLASLVEFIEGKRNSENALLLGIFHKNDGHIGNLKLEPIDFLRGTAMVGFLIGSPTHRGKGLSFLVGRSIIDYCHNELAIDTLELGVYRGHEGAIRAYEKLGFLATNVNKSVCKGPLYDQIVMTHWWYWQNGPQMQKCWSSIPAPFAGIAGGCGDGQASSTASDGVKTDPLMNNLDAIDFLLFDSSGTEISHDAPWSRVEHTAVVYKHLEADCQWASVFCKTGTETGELQKVLYTLRQAYEKNVQCVVPSLNHLQPFVETGWQVSCIVRKENFVHRAYQSCAGSAAHFFVVQSNKLKTSPLRQFVLGTAQLGLPGYGVANQQSELMPVQLASDIIETAVLAGIGSIDTASAYGKAEERVGESLARLTEQYPELAKTGFPDVVTKVHPNAGSAEELDQCIHKSTDALCHFKTDVTNQTSMLLHRWSMRHSADGVAWTKLVEWRNTGEAPDNSLTCRSSRKIGASIQTRDELMAAALDKGVQHIQLPFNVLDYRWRAPEIKECIQGMIDRGGTIHVRSVLLQGALTFTSLEQWPPFEDPSICKDIQRCITVLQEAVVKYNRISVIDLALAYVRAQPWIGGVIAGVNSCEMLLENLFLFSRPTLTSSQCTELEALLPQLSETILNPAFWPKKKKNS